MTVRRVGKIIAGALLACTLTASAGLSKPSDTLDSIRAKKPAPKPVQKPAQKLAPRKAPVASGPKAVAPKTGTGRQWLVSRSGGDFKTLAEALKTAPAGARLLVRSGSYAGNLVLNRSVEILAEPGGDGVVIEAASSPGVTISADQVRLSGLLFRCSSAGNGSVVEVSRGRTVLEDCAIEAGSNTSGSLTGLRVRSSGDVTLSRCQITGGAAGVRVTETAHCLLRTCDLSGSSSTGISVSDTADVRLYGCNLLNHADSGLVVAGPAQVLLDTCEIAGNRTGVLVNGSNPLLRKCRLRNNRAEGIAFRLDARGELNDCDVLENGVSGVSISQRSDPTLRNCRISKSGADNVRVFDTGRGTLEKCAISEGGTRGVALLSDADPTLRGCVIGPNRNEGVFVENARGLVEAGEVYGSAGAACVVVGQGANPRFTRCRIRQGRREGLLVAPGGQGLFESCDVFGHALVNVVVRPGSSPVFRACRVPLFDGATLAGWKTSGGPWQVADGILRNAKGRDEDWIESTNSLPAGEFAVEARLKIAAGQRLRILLTEGNSFYVGNEGSIHQIELYGKELSEVQQLVDDSYTHNTWYTYRLEIDEQSRVRLFRDGVLTHTARWSRAQRQRLCIVPGDGFSDGRIEIASLNLQLGGPTGPAAVGTGVGGR